MSDLDYQRKNYKRLSVYVPAEDLKRLKVKLAEKEISLAEWIRNQIRYFINAA